MKKSYNYYNRNLKPFAREHRNHSTQAEIKLWSEVLRASKLGFSFLRQRPIAKYIADFFCKDLKLIIEVDGLSHHDAEVFKADLIREKELKVLGYHVIRFNDDEVMNDLQNVIRTLEGWIEKNHPPGPLRSRTRPVQRGKPDAREKQLGN